MISNEVAVVLYTILSILLLVIEVTLAGIIISSILELVVDYFKDHRR